MRFDVVTLFPELFEPFLKSGVTRRAFESGQVAVRLWNLRDFAGGNYRRVDDRPFGGGPGMVMLAEPLAQCLAAVRADRAAVRAEETPVRPEPVEGPAPVVLFSPVGTRIDHAGVEHWSASAGAILLCGRYEGIDQRFIDKHVDVQLSLGDFVLSGGEIAAMALLDAVARLQPGVLNDAGSHQEDSFNPALDGLLDCPHYTRPEEWQGEGVPAELMSGHHAQIAQWRRRQRLELTVRHRPDLIAAARAAGRLTRGDETFLAALG
ncbi:tRNA (guanosine(37)-N1)-methyltransferase TrmD [Ramlibacter sp.]|uniref:tRNA (guanosine(37)-N1)-methyltransferase TrmD n=1 Tax=Ramlibacter sp. TaxID=1917967 RepID=UPI00180192F6|nr:tRNA (guanosine(37)-N1)-methyltransferase TrmD [Ramlibacter sp.]MBA2672920.1 tRNA (guanosine(37)-N1)-methyltransferase TrmD [Ramlibacter sp.]